MLLFVKAQIIFWTHVIQDWLLMTGFFLSYAIGRFIY